MIEPLSFVRADAQMAAGVVLFAVAVFRGAGPERMLSSALLAFLLIDWEWRQLSQAPEPMLEMTLSHVLLDLLLFGAIAYVALTTNRLYPLWMGGAQIGAITAHIVPATLKGVTPLTYALMNRLPLYVELVALAAGLAFHVARVQQSSESHFPWRPPAS